MSDFEQIESSQRQQHQENEHYEKMCNIVEQKTLALIGELKPKFFKDGNMWCFLYGENLQEGVAGFGETPYQAMFAFEKSFRNEYITRSGKGGGKRCLNINKAN
jgi:hypothetical protein